MLTPHFRACVRAVVFTSDENCAQVQMNHPEEHVKQKNEAAFWGQWHADPRLAC